jgi:hypothetical protein
MDSCGKADNFLTVNFDPSELLKNGIIPKKESCKRSLHLGQARSFSLTVTEKAVHTQARVPKEGP